jgi:predicted Zn-dependent protease
MRRSAGLVLANAGYVQAAADQLARASALAPGDPETALAAARALRRAGNPLAAEDVLLRALERVPGETRLAAELSGLRRDRPALHEPDGRS